MLDQAAEPVVIVQLAEADQQLAAFDLSRREAAASRDTPVFALPRCDPNGRGEIVVCARRPDQFSTKLHDPRGFEAILNQGMGPAALNLGGGTTLAVEVEQVDLGGVISNRVMVRFKLKL